MEKIVKTTTGRAHVYPIFGTQSSHTVDVYHKGKRKPFYSTEFSCAMDADFYLDQLKPEPKAVSSFQVKTNNQARFLFFGNELTAKEREGFDFSVGQIEDYLFFRYKGKAYHPNEFQRIIPQGQTKNNISDVFSMSAEMDKWDAVYSIDNWSGIVIRWCVSNHCEAVIVGSYIC